MRWAQICNHLIYMALSVWIWKRPVLVKRDISRKNQAVVGLDSAAGLWPFPHWRHFKTKKSNLLLFHNYSFFSLSYLIVTLIISITSEKSDKSDKKRKGKKIYISWQARDLFALVQETVFYSMFWITTSDRSVRKAATLVLLARRAWNSTNLGCYYAWPGSCLTGTCESEVDAVDKQ